MNIRPSEEQDLGKQTKKSKGQNQKKENSFKGKEMKVQMK